MLQLASQPKKGQGLVVRVRDRREIASYQGTNVSKSKSGLCCPCPDQRTEPQGREGVRKQGGDGDEGQEVEGLVLYALVILITVTWGRGVTMRSAFEDNYFSDCS